MPSAYGVLVVFHALAALVGFGSIGLTGTYAGLGKKLDRGNPVEVEELRRYFSGSGRVSKVVLLVPVLGAVAIALHRQWVDFTRFWVDAAFGCWLIAAAVAMARLWPAERVLRIGLSGAADDAETLADSGTGAPRSPVRLSGLCRRIERAALVCSLLFVVALALMILQPG